MTYPDPDPANRGGVSARSCGGYADGVAGTGHPDDEPGEYLRAHVADALGCSPEVASLDIEVRLVGDAVLVSGELTSDDQRDHAVALVRELVHPREVRDGLRVRALHDPDAAEDLP